MSFAKLQGNQFKIDREIAGNLNYVNYNNKWSDLPGSISDTRGLLEDGYSWSHLSGTALLTRGRLSTHCLCCLGCRGFLEGLLRPTWSG